MAQNNTIQCLNLILLMVIFFILLFIIFPQNRENFNTVNFIPESKNFGDCPNDDWESGCIGGSKFNCSDHCPPTPTHKELKGLNPDEKQQRIEEYKKYKYNGPPPNNRAMGTCCYRTKAPKNNPNKSDYQLRKGAPNKDAGCVRGKFFIGGKCPPKWLEVKADLSNDWYGICCRKPTITEKKDLNIHNQQNSQHHNQQQGHRLDS